MLRSRAFMRAGIVALLVSLGCRAAVAEDTTGWPARPDDPSGLQEGPCGGSCAPGVTCKYNRTRSSENGTVTYRPTPKSAEISVTYRRTAFYGWWPEARCWDHPDSPNHWQPCGSCFYEDLPVYWVQYYREVKKETIYAWVETSGEISIEGVGGSGTKYRLVEVGEKLNWGPWTLHSSGQYSKNACCCTDLPQPNGKFIYPQGRREGPPFAPPPSRPTGPITEPAGSLPSDISVPGNWPMPMRCQNPGCVNTGSVSYSSAPAWGKTPHTEQVWDPEGGGGIGFVKDLSAPDGWRTATKPLTKDAYTSVSAVWSVNAAKAKCSTARGPNHGPTGHTTATNVCTGVCEFEAIPQGNATRTWSRSYEIEPVFMLVTLPTVGTPIGSVTKTRNVMVDFVISYSDTWTSGASTGWDKPTISKCQCGPAPAWTPSTNYGDIGEEQRAADEKEEREGAKTGKPGEPVTTPR